MGMGKLILSVMVSRDGHETNMLQQQLQAVLLIAKAGVPLHGSHSCFSSHC